MIFYAAAANLDIPAADRDQSDHHANSGCFAGTIRPEESKDLSGRDIERQVADQRLAADFFGYAHQTGNGLHHFCRVRHGLTSFHWCI
ncbi:hypothetical protein D3C87_1800940 [compost metagenome]